MLARRVNLMTDFDSLWRIAESCFSTSYSKGFWLTDHEGKPYREFGTAVMLIVTELAEAVEAYRKGNIDGKDGVVEELGDAFIRLADLAFGNGYEIHKAIEAKMEYNRGREHLHGKLF